MDYRMFWRPISDEEKKVTLKVPLLEKMLASSHP